MLLTEFTICCFLGCAPVAQAEADAGRTAIPGCRSNQITIDTDGEEGNFNGMSQSGTLLVLRNIADSACSIDTIPQMVLKDKRNAPLGVYIDFAPFTRPIVGGKSLPVGHGPAVAPIAIAGGAEATATLHWIAGPVFAHSFCVDAAYLAVEVGGTYQQSTLNAHVCGHDRKSLRITATRLALDPRVQP